MTQARKPEIAPGVFQLQGLGAKVTLVRDGKEAILVDCGGFGSWPLLVAGLRGRGLAPGRISLAVLTHYHPDHSGGLGAAVAATGAEVAVHRSEASFINGEDPRPNPFTSPLLGNLARPFLPLTYGRPVPVDHVLEDGQFLPFSRPVQVVHTPGHTPGSVCLYLPEDKLLIVGDAIQLRSNGLTPPGRFVSHDMAQAVVSLEKLLDLDVETICFSHFPPLRHQVRQALVQLVHDFLPNPSQ